MSEGFDEARSRRNWLERLGEKIPGFRGFQDRELRREVDKMQREHMAREVGQLKVLARRKAQAFTDEGQIGQLDLFERLDRRLDGLGQSIRFADYGASGFFDVVKVHEPELERLYEFDLSLLEDLARLGADLAAIPAPGGQSPREAVDLALSRLGSLEDKWAGRDRVISNVVRASGPSGR